MSLIRNFHLARLSLYALTAVEEFSAHGGPELSVIYQ